MRTTWDVPLGISSACAEGTRGLWVDHRACAGAEGRVTASPGMSGMWTQKGNKAQECSFGHRRIWQNCKTSRGERATSWMLRLKEQAQAQAMPAGVR